MKVVIVLGGVPPSNALLERQLKGADFSIAADAGMKAFANAGQMPDKFRTNDFWLCQCRCLSSSPRPSRSAPLRRTPHYS